MLDDDFDEELERELDLDGATLDLLLELDLEGAALDLLLELDLDPE